MRRLAVWICILVLSLSFTTGVLADEIDDHKGEIEKVNQGITDTRELLDRVIVEQSKVAAQLTEINNDLEKKEEELVRTEDKLSETIRILEKTELELKAAEDECQEFEALMADRLCAIYMLGDSSYIELLVGAKSLNDFLDRLEMIRLMITYDNQVFDRITELRDAIEEKKEELVQQETSIRETKAEIIKQKSEIENQKQERLQLMAKLKEEEKRYGEELDRLERESQKIEADIRRLIREKEIKRQQEEQRQEEEQKPKGEQQPKEEEKPDKGSGQQDQGRGDQKPQGVMTWPAPGYYRITSDYGYRIHPRYKERRMHWGIDIGRNLNPNKPIEGAKAVAAAAGEVIISEYSSSYGNYVVIDHGGNIATLYAHGSKRLVEVGQNVSAGQAVIVIGNTGVSEGAHLHFEVRVNGTRVNPKPYLGI